MNPIQLTYKSLTYNYFDFSSRTNRHEFWVVIFGLGLIGMGITVFSMLGTAGSNISLLALALLIPCNSLAVRRFNDVGLSKSDYAIFMCAILLCLLAALICKTYSEKFLMAVSLWFLLGCIVALVVQFFRPSL